MAALDPDCQGWGATPEKGSALQEAVGGSEARRQAALGSWFRGAVLPGPFVSLQILGLTFAMTMYCQVVKADTYCS